MKLGNTFLMLLLLVFVEASFAGRPSTAMIRSLVDQYYQKIEFQKTFSRGLSADNRRPIRECREEGDSCTDVVCHLLGVFGCNELDEIREVGRSCRGNFDGVCLENVCKKLGVFGCNEIEEIRPVARACVGNYDTSCFESTCKRLGVFGCNELSEVEEVLLICSGN